MLFKTPRLIIRELKLSDTEDFYGAMSCAEVHDMYSNGFTSRDKAEEYIELIASEYRNGKYRTLAVADRETDKLAGSITLDIIKPFNHMEFSYWIVKELRNHGLGTETVKAIINYSFNTLSIHRVQAMTSNPASERVFLKSGMDYEGTLRDYFAKDGVYRDAKLYAVIKE